MGLNLLNIVDLEQTNGIVNEFCQWQWQLPPYKYNFSFLVTKSVYFFCASVFHFLKNFHIEILSKTTFVLCSKNFTFEVWFWDKTQCDCEKTQDSVRWMSCYGLVYLYSTSVNIFSFQFFSKLHSNLYFSICVWKLCELVLLWNYSRFMLIIIMGKIWNSA